MQPETATIPLLLTIGQVCEKINLGRTTFYQLRQSGGFAPTVHRLGGKLLVRADELTRWVESGMPPARLWNAQQEYKPQKQLNRPVAGGEITFSLRGGQERMTTNKRGDSIFNPDTIAAAIMSSYIFDPEPKEMLNFQSTSKARWTLTNWCDDFYEWIAGKWDRIPNSEIDLRIARHLQEHNEGGDVAFGHAPKATISKSLVGNVRLCLAARALRPATRTLNQWDNIEQDARLTLSMRNGLLVLHKNDQEELIPHTPDYFTFVQLPYDYDATAECTLWQSFLRDVMMDRTEYILLLQQWCGYLLRPDLRLQKFLLTVGEGANGKTVFNEVVQSLLGIENCSQIPISRFDSPFALVGTRGKMLNVTTEGVGMIEEEAETTLKSFVSGDRMTFERKFRDAVSDVPTAKIMVSTNDLPRFNDKSQAIWRRILLVPFDKKITEKNQIDSLAEELKTELPGILRWSIDGLRSLNAAGRFTMPENSKTLLEQYRCDVNPARAFLLETMQRPTTATR